MTKLAGHPAAAALRNRAFRRYLAGQLPSVTCSWAQVVALSLVVAGLDPGALGWVVALQFAPSLLLGPWFGAVADRHDRRRLLILAEAGLGLVALSYAVLSGTGGLGLPAIFVLATAWGVLNALDTPARRALVPMLVPREVAASASALTGTVMLLGMTAGSALGAALVTAAGPTAAFAVNAASFGVDVLVLWTIRAGPAPRVARAPGQIRAGLRHVWHTPALRTALLALAAIATFSFTLQVSVPIFVLVSLHGKPALVGIALSAAMAGSLAGALTAAATGGPGPRTLTRATLGMAGGLTVTAAAPTAIIALAGLAVVGFSWSIMIAAVIATLQTTEPSMIGRVMSTLSVVLLGGMAAGAPITSAIITFAGPRIALAIGALTAMLTFAYCRALVPATKWSDGRLEPKTKVHRSGGGPVQQTGSADAGDRIKLQRRPDAENR
jgi:MFS family permease